MNMFFKLCSFAVVQIKLIFARQVSKESTIEMQKSVTDVELEELKKWLKTIIPFDYLNQALEAASRNGQTLNSNLTSVASNSKPSAALSSESSEIISSLMKEPEAGRNHQVVVMSINDQGYDCPGMLSEEKVVKEFENSQLINKTKQKSGSSKQTGQNQHTLKVTHFYTLFGIGLLAFELF